MFDLTVNDAIKNAIQSAWQQNKNNLSQPNNPRFVEHSSTPIQRNGLNVKQLKLDQNSLAGTYVKDKWKDDHDVHSTTFDDLDTRLTLDYTVEVVGIPSNDSGQPLYIALHGGGGPEKPTKESVAEANKINDSAWKDMTTYYKGAIQSGVWVAARGVGDSWDMHFTGASYVLIERLVENMILFGVKDKSRDNPVAIDPNRVYLIGFSAGGDGVYRLAPRLAQRFAAVNMGGGHPGSVILGAEVPPPRTGTILRNLANTPICVQVGERDSEYAGRSRLVAQSAEDLAEVKKHYTKIFPDIKSPPIYFHNIFIHPTDTDPQRGPNESDKDFNEKQYSYRHNSWEQGNFNWSDSNKPRPKKAVIRNYAAWRKGWVDDMPKADRATKDLETNAIDWLNHHTRTATPQAIVWDLSRDEAKDQFDDKVFGGLSGNGAQNYWLDVSGKPAEDVGTLIEARIDHDTSTIYVTAAGTYLRILLRPEMVRDMSNVKVQIKIGDQPQTTLGPFKLGWNQAIINHTLARNDPELIFSSDIVMNLTSSGWLGTTSSPALVKAML
ncbi:hypothetical protein BJ166DRAFT_589117 [Pestalotiopsis sp. NC0098]|nr:hypothetical protein BJ166DRAFT_589117 [Pestalotiopsis sp. NC0098]